MHAPGENEKQALLEKGAVISIRRGAPADAPALHAIISDTIARPFSTATLDAPPTLASLESSIRPVGETPGLIFDVAVDQMSGKVLGLMNLGEYTAKAPGARSCFARSASLQVVTANKEVIGSDLESRVESALINHAVAACRTGANGYRTVVVDLLVRQDEDPSLSRFQNFLDAGFKVVGRLEEVAEKEHGLLNQVFLQCRPHVEEKGEIREQH